MNRILFAALAPLILAVAACAPQETPPQDSTVPFESQTEDDAATIRIVEESSSIAVKSLDMNRDAVEELLRVSDCGTRIDEEENWNKFVNDYVKGWSGIAEETARSIIVDSLVTPSTPLPGKLLLKTVIDEIADAAPDRLADVLEQWGCSKPRETSKGIAEIVRKSAECIPTGLYPFVECALPQ